MYIRLSLSRVNRLYDKTERAALTTMQVASHTTYLIKQEAERASKLIRQEVELIKQEVDSIKQEVGLIMKQESERTTTSIQHTAIQIIEHTTSSIQKAVDAFKENQKEIIGEVRMPTRLSRDMKITMAREDMEPYARERPALNYSLSSED